MNVPGIVAVLVAALAAACTVKVNHVRVETERLDARVPDRLRCAYRLQSVSDLRPDGDRSGALGTNLLSVQDAAASLRSQLLQAGFKESGPGTSVSIELLRLYMRENLYTRLPTVVYRAQVDGDELLIRSQIGSMSWSSDPQNVYEGYSAALQDAHGRLIQQLNARCG